MGIRNRNWLKIEEKEMQKVMGKQATEGISV
jgi:hypothetical protein